jgi:hypothetical protein
MRKRGILLAMFFLLIINCGKLFAQGVPCDDPDVTCPLDTWVLLLAGAFLIFATVRLYKKQKLYNTKQA